MNENINGIGKFRGAGSMPIPFGFCKLPYSPVSGNLQPDMLHVLYAELHVKVDVD